jgi:hypothetical protein
MESRRGTIINPVIGVSLIVVGALFLLINLFHIGSFWPLFILTPGVLLLFFTVKVGRSAAPLAIPAVLVAGTGAILLYQSVTGDWKSWAYAWTLYPALLGGGMALMGRLEQNERAIRNGRGLVALGLGAFVVFWLFFRITIFSGIFSGLALPLILIAGGVLWMLRGTRHNGSVLW